MAITPENQALTKLRHKAYMALCRQRQYKAAGITVQRADGKAHFFFQGTEILCLDAGYGVNTVGHALIYHLNAWTRDVMAAVGPIFQANIEAPARHALRLPTLATKVSDYSFTGNESIHIRLEAPDMYDADQFYVEFRMFPHECHAHLFMSYGPQHDFIAKDLLRDREAFVYAETPDQMAQMLIERFKIGMARAQELTAAAAT